MTFGNIPSINAKDYQPIGIPIASSRKDYQPIPIFIPNTKGEEKIDLIPQPGFNVTLLMNYKVHFEWSNNTKNNNPSKKFVIKDSKGNKVFEKAFGNKNSIDILPRELKLKSGQKYFWNVDENSRTYEFKILDEQIEKELLKNLAEIDAEGFSPDECILEKATYLEMLSYQQPEIFDLYWLIAQWVSPINPTDEKLLKKKEDILQRCVQHLDDEI